MIVPEKMSLSDFVSRRLNPVKVTIFLLQLELKNSANAQKTEIDRNLLDSAVSTLELFVEDYEKLVGRTNKTGATGDRKFVEAPKSSLLGSS